MTHEDAIKLTSFGAPCNCGAVGLNESRRLDAQGNVRRQPHLSWCPQYAIFAEWWDAVMIAPVPRHLLDEGL